MNHPQSGASGRHRLNRYQLVSAGLEGYLCALLSLNRGYLTNNPRAAMSSNPGAEILDVVDDTDSVTGSATRYDIHVNKLRHRAAHIFLCNSRKQIFLQRRALWKECAPGLWDSAAAGHVAQNEDYANAAARELEEELGVPATTFLTRFAQLAASPDTGLEFVAAYFAIFDGDVVPDPHEIMDSRWCTVDELEVWMAAAPDAFTATFRVLWARFKVLKESPIS